MPYISPRRRGLLDGGFYRPANPGELNYLITQQFESYRRQHGDSYTTFNDIAGAAANAAAEFYRRVVVPYEDRKLEENGDVYA